MSDNIKLNSGFLTITAEHNSDDIVDGVSLSMFNMIRDVDAGSLNMDSWQASRCLHDVYKKHITNFQEWVKLNISSNDVSPHRKHLITDTISYLNHGVRPMHISTRFMLCHNDKNGLSYEDQRIDDGYHDLQIDSDSVITEWITRGNVLDLYMFFKFIFSQLKE